MTVRTTTSGAMALILFSALGTLPMAQTQVAAASANAHTLPAGLDTRFIDTTTDPCVDFARPIPIRLGSSE